MQLTLKDAYIYWGNGTWLFLQQFCPVVVVVHVICVFRLAQFSNYPGNAEMHNCAHTKSAKTTWSQVFFWKDFIRWINSLSQCTESCVCDSISAEKKKKWNQRILYLVRCRCSVCTCFRLRKTRWTAGGKWDCFHCHLPELELSGGIAW